VHVRKSSRDRNFQGLEVEVIFAKPIARRGSACRNSREVTRVAFRKGGNQNGMEATVAGVVLGSW
jgi:hypothetical protein